MRKFLLDMRKDFLIMSNFYLVEILSEPNSLTIVTSKKILKTGNCVLILRFIFSKWESGICSVLNRYKRAQRSLISNTQNKAFVKYCNTSFYINSTILQFKLRKSCVVLFCFFPSAAWHVSVFGIFRFVFSRIRTEYGDLLCKSPYSVQMRENRDQKNSLRIQTLFA